MFTIIVKIELKNCPLSAFLVTKTRKPIQKAHSIVHIQIQVCLEFINVNEIANTAIPTYQQLQM